MDRRMSGVTLNDKRKNESRMTKVKDTIEEAAEQTLSWAEHW